MISRIIQLKNVFAENQDLLLSRIDILQYFIKQILQLC